MGPARSITYHLTPPECNRQPGRSLNGATEQAGWPPRRGTAASPRLRERLLRAHSGQVCNETQISLTLKWIPLTTTAFGNCSAPALKMTNLNHNLGEAVSTGRTGQPNDR